MSAPYRLVTRPVRNGPDRAEATWTPTGGELGPVADRPPRVPGCLFVEAMAQCAGMLLGDELGDRWMLAGVDACRVDPSHWGQAVDVSVRIERGSGAAARVRASASAQGREVACATLLMARLRLP